MSELFFPSPPNHPFSRPFLSMPLAELASKLFSSNPSYSPKIIDVEKRVRGVLAGKVIFDTTEAKLVWEHKWFPQYWIPKSAFLSTATFTEDRPISGIDSSTSKLTVGKKSVSTLLVPNSFNTPLAGLVKIDFKALDAWYEELTQVAYHPKDPFHRVDTLPSGRSVQIEVDGKVLADTGDQGGVISLWETGFPPRWYLPRTAVSWEYLTDSETHTGCPYKGEASYYNAVIDGKEIKDIVWWYKAAFVECASITGMLCFYPEKVDMWIDGKKQEKAGMPFGKPIEQKQKTENPQENGAHTHEGAKSCDC